MSPRGWPPVLLDLLAPIASLLVDPDVTDIMLDGEAVVRVDRVGRPREALTSRLGTGRELESLMRYLARLEGADPDAEHLTVQLPDGSRVHAIAGSLAHRGGGPWITIRRFRRAHLDADALVSMGAVPRAVIDGLVADLVVGRCNLVVSGPTGSGKTTVAEVLLRALPPCERLMILQDVEEIVAPSEAYAWGSFRPGEGGYEALLASLLRMQPDRLAVGELRGPEAWVFLDALTTGHEGGVTTVHAASPTLALRRLEGLALQHPHAPDVRAVRLRLAEAVHVVVQTERRLVDGRFARGVSAVAEVEGVDPDGQVRTRLRWARDHTRVDLGHPH